MKNTPGSSKPFPSVLPSPPQRTSLHTFKLTSNIYLFLHTKTENFKMCVNSPLVLLLHHLANHFHSLLSAGRHSGLIELSENLDFVAFSSMSSLDSPLLNLPLSLPQRSGSSSQQQLSRSSRFRSRRSSPAGRGRTSHLFG